MSERITSPGITLELEGQEYQFRLDFTAMADFEKATGKGVLELFGEVFAAIQEAVPAGKKGGKEPDMGALLGRLSLKASDLQALAWACLGGEDSPVSLREAGRLIHAGNIQQVIVALAEALRVALPEAKPEDEQSHPPAGPAGSPSGLSADKPSV